MVDVALSGELPLPFIYARWPICLPKCWNKRQSALHAKPQPPMQCQPSAKSKKARREKGGVKRRLYSPLSFARPYQKERRAHRTMSAVSAAAAFAPFASLARGTHSRTRKYRSAVLRGAGAGAPEHSATREMKTTPPLAAGVVASPSDDATLPAAKPSPPPSRRETIASALSFAALCFVAQPPQAAAGVTGDALPTVLVVGATGQTGRLVVDELRKRGGADVVAAVRSPDKAKKMGLDAGGVTLLPGFDVTGRAQHTEANRGNPKPFPRNPRPATPKSYPKLTVPIGLLIGHSQHTRSCSQSLGRPGLPHQHSYMWSHCSTGFRGPHLRRLTRAHTMCPPPRT